MIKIFLNLDKLKASQYGAFIAGYDTTRTLHMALSAAFMGPWFAWWYPYLARNYTSVWTRLGLELLTGSWFDVLQVITSSKFHKQVRSKKQFLFEVVKFYQK